MREGSTYRHARRNTYGKTRHLNPEFERISGKGWKNEFDAEVKYQEPKVRSKYWPNTEDKENWRAKYAHQLRDNSSSAVDATEA